MKRTAAILDVRDLGIQRGNTRILDGVNWRVERGQHWFILGSNGSGKTSLLAALTGYLTPTEGELELLGERFGEADWRSLRLHIGIVSSAIRQLMAPEEPALETVISGKFAMIDLWESYTAADKRNALRLLRQIECAHLSDRPWLYLSQGERQRVLIGRALMAKPRLLILDEPCAGLDPVAREHFLQFLQRLGKQRNAPTLVLVTHHVEEIMPVFTHGLILREGRVLAAGPKKKMLNAQLLSAAFGSKVALGKQDGRLTLRVAPRRKSVV